MDERVVVWNCTMRRLCLGDLVFPTNGHKVMPAGRITHLLRKAEERGDVRIFSMDDPLAQKFRPTRQLDEPVVIDFGPDLIVTKCDSGSSIIDNPQVNIKPEEEVEFSYVGRVPEGRPPRIN